MIRVVVLFAGILLTGFLAEAQDKPLTFFGQEKIIQKLDEFAMPVMVNPDFITRYNIKSVVLNVKKGKIGLDSPKPRPPQVENVSLNKLVFNMSGRLEELYFINEKGAQDTLEALFYQYDNWGKPTVASSQKGREREKQIFNYKEGLLREIATFDKHGDTGSGIKLFRNRSNQLDRKEEFVENNRLQTEYFCSVDTPEDILDYLKETEIGNRLAEILIIYIEDKGRLKKEITHTSFSDYSKRYTYDRNNRIVATSQSDYGRMVMEVFKYDALGNLNEYIHSSVGLSTTKIIYDYDTNGVFLSKIKRIVDGEIMDEAIISYKFRY